MTRPVIAVVDGAPAFLEMMHELLTEHGYQPLVWSTGQGAFELIVHEQPDLVILDLWLDHPHAGEMVLGLMQMDPTTRDIPVIICTTDRRLLQQRPAVMQDKPYDIVIKPFDLQEVQTKIKMMLRLYSRSVAQQGC